MTVALRVTLIVASILTLVFIARKSQEFSS